MTPLEIVKEQIKKEKKLDFDEETPNNAVLEGLAAGRLQYNAKYFNRLN